MVTKKQCTACECVFDVGDLRLLRLVVLTGAVQLQLVDTSFFRAVGLLLAVLLSLRAKNAVSRRQKLMSGVLDMMNCAKNLGFAHVIFFDLLVST